MWITVQYSQKILTKNKENLLESEPAALFEMMKKYILLVDDNSIWDSLKDTFGLSKAKYSLLYVVSEWLGHEFHQLEPVISQKVQIYKKQNIHNIARLPTYEETIDLLFPRCMKKLVTRWLGESTNLSDGNRSVECDHDYILLSKRQRADLIKYPKVQFILEFATNSLISGIAHVANSRLTHY